MENLKPLPPPPKRNGAAAAMEAQAPTNGERFAIQSGKIISPQRIVIYGPGGIGKSTLAALAPEPAFADIEHGTNELNVSRVGGIRTFADLRACLQSDAFDGFKSIVLDTATKAEELAVAHTLGTIPNDKGSYPSSVEGYGFGKGYQHVYETFLLLLADLDSQVRRGRNVILIAHDCTADVPNPAGEDYLRYEPHLQSPKSGKASIRNRVIQWADHVLFIGYDVIATDGKGKGGGTRTIWTFELPDHIAKSRIVSTSMPYTSATDGAIWNAIFGGVQ